MVLIATRIVRLLMELSFLQERRYRPYDKWFGSAFARLSAAPVLDPRLDAILAAQDAATRIDALHDALFLVAGRHNALGLTPHILPAVDCFHVGINDAIRPYRVINAGKFVEGCKAAIANHALRELMTVGTFDQLTHADDALVNFSTWPKQIAKIYEHQLEASPLKPQNSRVSG